MAVGLPSLAPRGEAAILMKLTTFIYHDVLDDAGADDSGFPGTDALSYKLLDSRFRRHLELIAEACGTSQPLILRSPADIGQRPEGLVLTFDDGGASGLNRIAGQLEARGWRGHFFVTSNYINQRGFLSEADLRQLHAAGHSVGSHSASHPIRISQLDRSAIFAEWRDSCARIADILGQPVVCASVPGGFYSVDVARAAAEAGIRILFTSEPTRGIAAQDGIAIIGRFSVTRRTSDAEITSLAKARPITLLRHRLMWDGKKLLKRIGGGVWLSLRKKLFDLGLG